MNELGTEKKKTIYRFHGFFIKGLHGLNEKRMY